MARHAENTMQALAMADQHPGFNWTSKLLAVGLLPARASRRRPRRPSAALREGRMGVGFPSATCSRAFVRTRALNRATLPPRPRNRGSFDSLGNPR